MPQIDSAVLSVGTGNFYTCPYVTATPTAAPATKPLLLAPATPWASIGHTSLEDILSVSSEGGEATVLGTLQNRNLRTSYSARTEALAIVLQQADEPGLKLYYGDNFEKIDSANNGGTGAGVSLFNGVPALPTPAIRSFLAVFQDGAQVFAFYAPKAEIYRSDDLEIADTESLLGLPLNVKPLIHGTNKWAYAVTPLLAL